MSDLETKFQNFKSSLTPEQKVVARQLYEKAVLQTKTVSDQEFKEYIFQDEQAFKDQLDWEVKSMTFRYLLSRAGITRRQNAKVQKAIKNNKKNSNL